MWKRAKARENELLAKVSPKDTPISFSSKDGCLKHSYGGGGGGGTAVLCDRDARHLA